MGDADARFRRSMSSVASCRNRLSPSPPSPRPIAPVRSAILAASSRSARRRRSSTALAARPVELAPVSAGCAGSSRSSAPSRPPRRPEPARPPCGGRPNRRSGARRSLASSSSPVGPAVASCGGRPTPATAASVGVRIKPAPRGPCRSSPARPFAGQRQAARGGFRGLLDGGLGSRHVQFLVVLAHLDARRGHMRRHQIIPINEAAQVVHGAVPAARLRRACAGTRRSAPSRLSMNCLRCTR